MKVRYFVEQVARDLGIEKDFATQDHPGGIILEDGNSENRFLVTIDENECCENVGVIQVSGRLPEGASPTGLGLLRIYEITSIQCEVCGREDHFLEFDNMQESDWCPDIWWTEKSGGFSVCPTCSSTLFEYKDGADREPEQPGFYFSLDKLEENYPDLFRDIVNTICKRMIIKEGQKERKGN